MSIYTSTDLLYCLNCNLDIAMISIYTFLLPYFAWPDKMFRFNLACLACNNAQVDCHARRSRQAKTMTKFNIFGQKTNLLNTLRNLQQSTQSK